jgi:hypothetical protein
MIYLVFHTVWKYTVSIVFVHEKDRGGVDFSAHVSARTNVCEMNERRHRGSAEPKAASSAAATGGKGCVTPCGAA